MTLNLMKIRRARDEDYASVARLRRQTKDFTLVVEMLNEADVTVRYMVPPQVKVS